MQYSNVFTALLFVGLNIPTSAYSTTNSYTRTDVGNYFYSIRYGNYDEINEFLLKENSLDATNGNGENSLTFAAKHCLPTMVEFFIKKGIEVDRKNKIHQQTALSNAISNRCFDVVKVLIKNNANPTILIRYKKTPIEYSISGNKADILKYIIEQRSDVIKFKNYYNQSLLFIALNNSKTETGIIELLSSFEGISDVTDKNGDNAIGYLIKKGNLDILKLVLKGKNNLNFKNQNGMTALHIAANTGKKSMVELLLAYGANVNAQNRQGNTALLISVINKNINVTILLLNHNANKDIVNRMGESLEVLARNTENIELIKLVELPFEINEIEVQKKSDEIKKITPNKSSDNSYIDVNQTNKRTETLLMLAARKSNKTEVLKLLKDKNLQINKRDHSNKTALHYAIEGRSKEIIKLLLRHGAKPNVKDNDGFTPLLNACRHFKPELGIALLEGGADANARQGSVGLNALGWVSNDGHIKLMETLLKYGADPNFKDLRGRTALLRAAWYNQPKLSSLLIKNGADVNHQSQYGTNPLSLAVTRGQLPLVKVLLSAGANTRLKDDGGRIALLNAISKAVEPSVIIEILDYMKPNKDDLEDMNKVLLASSTAPTKVLKIIINCCSAENINYALEDPLSRAVFNNKVENVIQMLIYKNKLNLDNVDFKPLIKIAQDKNFKEIIKILNSENNK